MNATKFMAASDNLIRYSEQEALDGDYLNAVLILHQTATDVNRKLGQGIISGDQAVAMLGKINNKKTQFISEAKNASPKKFVYELPCHQQKLTQTSTSSAAQSSLNPSWA